MSEAKWLRDTPDFQYACREGKGGSPEMCLLKDSIWRAIKIESPSAWECLVLDMRIKAVQMIMFPAFTGYMLMYIHWTDNSIPVNLEVNFQWFVRGYAWLCGLGLRGRGFLIHSCIFWFIYTLDFDSQYG